jgi:hypothetical protein
LDNNQAYSIDGGYSWTSVTSPLSGQWYGIGFGHGTFVAVGQDKQAYSSDGKTWTLVNSPLPGGWRGVAWSPMGDANGTFAMVSDGGGGFQAYSRDSGRTWTLSSTQISGNWKSVTLGNGFFVAVGTTQIYGILNGNLWYNIPFPYYGTWNSVAYDGNNTYIAVGSGGGSPNSLITASLPTVQWIPIASPPLYGFAWNGIAFGNVFGVNTFVIVSPGGDIAYSTDNGTSWTNVFPPFYTIWTSVTFGNGVFVAVAPSFQAYSTNGSSWTPASSIASGYWSSVAYNTPLYGLPDSYSPDSVSLLTPPIQVVDRTFTSTNYSSISFEAANDAAFWGFDSREALTYLLPASPRWTYTQSGWIAGFLPPSMSTYDDSVANKLCKAVRILVGKQVIKEYTGEYIELQNDLLVPYENKAILKLMNGTLDQTQAVSYREYYTSLPLGTKEVPLCALTHQNMSVEIDFESYQNLSQNLNPGTGAFTDAKSYATYTNQQLNARSTLSYQQYIFIITYDERLIVFDTTQNISTSTVFSISGSRQLCIQSAYLYIGLSDGQLGRVLLSDVIQGSISSYTTNGLTISIINDAPMISDFRYVYFTCDLVIVRYDTTSSFTDFYGSYVLGNYYVKQLILTGLQIIMIPVGQPGKLYMYKLNADFRVQWNPIDYSAYGYQITEGVLIGGSVYFICDGNKILQYSNSTFTVLIQNSIFAMVGSNPFNPQLYSVTSGRTWTVANTGIYATWTVVAFGNGVFVTAGYDNFGIGKQAYSLDYGKTWTAVSAPLSGIWLSAAFGNGVFVMFGGNAQAYSLDNGKTWTAVSSPLSGFWLCAAFGNGVFVVSATDNQAYSLDNGKTWTAVNSPLSGNWTGLAYGNGVFVMSGQDNQAYSLDKGKTWTAVISPLNGNWVGLTFGNGVFVMNGTDKQAYSTNNGKTWTAVSSPLSGVWLSVAYGNGVFAMSAQDNQAYSLDKGQTWTAVSSPVSSGFSYLGASTSSYDLTGTRNLMAMGNYIYASADQGVIRINVSSASIEYPAPVSFDGSASRVFAHGPRYVYMFTHDSISPTSVIRYDPYSQTSSFKTSILVDYESLPPEVPKPDKALLGFIQTQKVIDMTNMDIKGPVKELWVTGVSATTNVFQYSNLAPRSTLKFAGEKIVTEDDGTRTFLNIIEPFELHTSMPIRNVSVVAFELEPESEIPNGTINFSRIRDQVFEGGAKTIWARNYNLLAIQGGIGGLIFNS